MEQTATEVLDAERVEQMLTLARTKPELQELVRSLDAANVKLRRVIRSLTSPHTGEEN